MAKLEDVRWWCEWCGDDFYAPANAERCKMCNRHIDDQVDPEDDDIGMYPMGRKAEFKKNWRKEHPTMTTRKNSSKVSKSSTVVAATAKYTKEVKGQCECGACNAKATKKSRCNDCQPSATHAALVLGVCRRHYRAARRAGLKLGTTTKKVAATRSNTKRAAKSAVREKASKLDAMLPKKSAKKSSAKK